MPKLIAILVAVLVGAVIALGLCQAMSGREGWRDDPDRQIRAHFLATTQGRNAQKTCRLAGIDWDRTGGYWGDEACGECSSTHTCCVWLANGAINRHACVKLVKD